MKANELRIGNWVELKTEFENEIHKVYDVCQEMPFLDTKKYGVGTIIWDEIYPIPLTEEWLIKFGFEEESLSQFVFKWQDNDNCSSFFVYSDWCTISVNHSYKDSHEDDYVVHRKIEYVHQLQNLYFALTGEELTTKIK